MVVHVHLHPPSPGATSVEVNNDSFGTMAQNQVKRRKRKEEKQLNLAVVYMKLINHSCKGEFEHTEGEIGEGHLSNKKSGNPLLVGKVTGLTPVS